MIIETGFIQRMPTELSHLKKQRSRSTVVIGHRRNLLKLI